MYNLEDLRKSILSNGIPAVIQYLTSEEISIDEKEALKKNGVLSDTGRPYLSLLFSLGLMAQ